MLTEKYQPGTFLERGVAVPFTTPMLIGTRARPSARDSVELIVPNPSGSRGVYLFDWSSLDKFCRPTLHDIALTERVVRLSAITPASIHRAAGKVALTGLAGRDVAAAASKALQTEQKMALFTNFQLLIALMRQVETPEPGQVAPECDDPVHMQERARRAISRFAPRLGLHTNQVADMLEELSELFVRIGVGDTAERAHLPHLLQDLKLFRQDLASWAATHDGIAVDLARQIVSQAEATIELAEPLLAAAQLRGQNVLQLLRDKITNPAKVASEITRPDWLLDGWELICFRWRAAAPEHREDVLDELSALLPPVPDEVQEWGYFPPAEEERVFLRKVQAGYDWRTGLAAFEATRRGEETLRLSYEGAEA